LKTANGTRDFQLPNHKISQLQNLLHFFMRRMLAAPATELFQFQPVRRRLAVLRRRIVPLFAITALHRNDLSGHKQLLASKIKPKLYIILRRLQPPKDLCN
jgi:hypothetical protein